MVNNTCTCEGSTEPKDEETSSLEARFFPPNLVDSNGHRYTTQESAAKAFDTLGLKRKSEE